MADIAMWVLEEFERREKGGEVIKQEMQELASMTITAISRKVEDEISSLKEVAEEKLVALEPKSSFTVAAFDGVFSP